MALQHPFLTTTVKQHIIDLSRRGDIKQAKDYLAKTLRVKKSQKNDWYRKIMIEAGLPVGTVGQQKQFEGGDSDIPSSSMSAKATYAGDTGVAESVTKDIRSLDDLIKACNIDLEVWEVERYVVNKWAVAMREPATTVGGRGKDAEVHINEKGGRSTLWTRGSHIPVREPLFQVKAWLRRKKEATDLKLLLQKFIAEAEAHAPITFEYVTPDATRDCVYVLNIQDLHLAKLAYNRETGHGDYDIHIAQRVFNDAVHELVAKAPHDRIEEVVVIVGSDMLQVDNDQSQTAKGTYVDSDSRLPKIYDVAIGMLTTNIEQLAQRFRVRVMTFPGNHDSTVSLFLGYYLSAFFKEHGNVVVDKSAGSRKYVPWGKTLIGFDHGDEAKLSELPLTMMRENQATVSQFKYMEMLTGHLHQEASDEYKGVKVRVAPALCPPDKWHARRAYIGNIQTSQGLLYSRENGLEAIYYSKPLN
jgi:hypothetical protein